MTWQDLLETPGLLEMYLRALAAGGAVVTMCSVLSVLVVVKRLGFVGQGVSHSAFGGIGVAALLGVMLPKWGIELTGKPLDFALMSVVVGFCVAAAVGMAVVSGKHASGAAQRAEGGASEDTAIGLFLVGSMALGAVLVHVARTMAKGAGSGTPVQSWESILFGSILTVDHRDVGVGMFVAAAVLGAVWWWRRPLLFWVLDEDSAPAFGVPVHAMRLLLMVLLAVAIVVSMRLAGVVLATALLVLPGATALKLGRGNWGLPGTIGASVLCGLIGLVGGLVMSLKLDWQPGPCVVLVLTAAFMAVQARGRLAPASGAGVDSV